VVDILIKYIHILSFMVVFTVLFLEMVFVKTHSAVTDLVRVRRYQNILLLFLGFTLLSGLVKLMTMGEHAAIYMKNGVFHLKVTLFILITILTFIPYRFFRKVSVDADEARTQQAVHVPGSVRVIVHIQMILLVLLPLLGVMMVRGIGYFG